MRSHDFCESSGVVVLVVAGRTVVFRTIVFLNFFSEHYLLHGMVNYRVTMGWLSNYYRVRGMEDHLNFRGSLLREVDKHLF